MLSDLMLMIWILIGCSLGISLIAGYLLAKRALIPIQASWERQRQFAADASHELRTPLSVMQLHLERLFRFPDRTIEEESQPIAVLIEETKRMNKLVSDLMLLARSDSNEPVLLLQPLDLTELVNIVVQQFQIAAEQKGISLSSSVHTPMRMNGDRERLLQLLVILLDNAVKYTPSGDIRVSAARKGNEWRVWIEDSGIGISEADLPHIFDRFYRADKARNRNDGGAGLGLSIAKWIAESHEGSLTATSQSGEGSSFQLSFKVESGSYNGDNGTIGKNPVALR